MFTRAINYVTTVLLILAGAMITCFCLAGYGALWLLFGAHILWHRGKNAGDYRWT